MRPEHLSIVAENDECAIPAIVTVTEPTGAETLVFFRFGTHDLSVIARERVAAPPGSRIGLRLSTSFHIFDAANGRRLVG